MQPVKGELEAAAKRQENPWEGITYAPHGSPENLFSVTVVDNGGRRNIGHFPTLLDAQNARDRYIDYHGNKQTRETATYPNTRNETV